MTIPKQTEGNSIIVQLENVWVYYDGIPALEKVNLSIAELDFLGIIGPNGSGKTTLLKVILGLIKPSRGTVRILGNTPQKARKFIGYVPQSAQYDRSFPVSVHDVVLMGRLTKRRSFRRYTEEDRKIAADALKRVEMFDLKDKPIGKLSGGQQQRVFVARALAARPKLLILDEPTASIDNKAGIELYELLKQLNNEITIVMVSHDISVISTYVKQIACMNRTLFYHPSTEITAKILEEGYQCPVELIAHGFVPHRVLKSHTKGKKE